MAARLVEVGVSEAAGMGTAPISWREIDAWRNRSGLDPSPWEGRLLCRMGNASSATIVAYVDAAEARGVSTFEVRSILTADGSITSNLLKDSCKTLDSRSAFVDAVYLNDTCQTAIAAAAFAQQNAWNLP